MNLQRKKKKKKQKTKKQAEKNLFAVEWISVTPENVSK